MIYPAVHRTTTREFPVLRLRQARVADAPFIDLLIARSWRALGTGHYTPQQVDSAVRYVSRADIQLIQDGTFYVITSGRHLVACGGWSKRGALYGSSGGGALDPARDAAKARAFFVDPQWARRGLATRLMAEATAAAWDAGFRQIELLATRMGEPLYRKLGYQALEAVEVVLPDGVTLETNRMMRNLD